MANNGNPILRGILWAICGYHVVLGVLGIILPTELLLKIGASAFHFSLTETPQIGWVARPFATYLLAFGVFMGIAARDPVKFRPIIYGGILLIGVRLIQRIIFMMSGFETFGINPMRSWGMLAFSTLMGLGLLMFVRKE